MELLFAAITAIVLIAFCRRGCFSAETKGRFGGSGSAERIGRRGEKRVSRELRRLPDSEYVVLNDLTITDRNGRTTQIDHVVISRFGIFVIETKCYKGWIFGDEKGKVWTQSLSCGRGWTAETEKHTFQNPIRQNWRHIFVLSERLDLPMQLFRNVVVFAGESTFKTFVPGNVMHEYELPGYVKSFDRELLGQQTVNEISEKLRHMDLSGTEDCHEKHLHSLQVNLVSRQQRYASEDAPKCPKCGAKMRRRFRHSDNAPFYGCSRYPECKGTASIIIPEKELAS